MNDSFSQEQELQLRKVEELLLESMETVFQTSINPDITLDIDKVGSFDKSAVKNALPEGLVTIKIAHKNPASGVEFLIFGQSAAAKISDMMVMGDGTAEFNPDEHLDAIQEISDQIFGAFSNTPIDFVPGDRDFNLAEAAHGDISLLEKITPAWTSVNFILNVGGEYKFFHLLSPEAVDNYIKKKAKEQSVVDEVFNGVPKPMKTETAVKPQAAQFQSFGPEKREEGKDLGEIEKLLDLRLQIVIELGRTSMFIKDILKLSPGSIVELNKLSGDPVDIYVNDKVFAEGEVVVIDENFGVRITNLVKPEERLRKLS